jgi:hypothetical protein
VKYFYDTEFLEDGKTIELISIGIVRDDGFTYYAVNADMPVERIIRNDWLMKNVAPSLPGRKPAPPIAGSDMWYWNLDKGDVAVKPHWVIANEVRHFFEQGADGVELWADYSAYDHVALAQLWGRMIDLPKGMPMYTHEFQQKLEDLGFPDVPEQTGGLHNALADARHLESSFRHIERLAA